MIVVDASVVAASLVDGGPAGTWADALIAANPLAAPHLMPAEVTSVVRRGVLAGSVSEDVAQQVRTDLTLLPVELFEFGPLSARVWELCRNVTPYDAWYVALAESLDAPLATLDHRLRRASGPRCEFVALPGA